ncbi:hypothetical protein [Saccharopolyspora rectivirgula]|jgi:hypothetical protein|uniref:ESX-1 secretion-associated protein n=1 Tax=Saccharopolyspora rectivirgula TaxID=28042 RepID=A0A073BBR8_9PSEU|nr:hypothetical protein [Saccharopolyspora rectivirgula]KEI45184.1 hypothetical protein GU90_05210 [Saccharopolyspora rectivirgula]
MPGSGIRVDVEWLDRCAGQLERTGEDVLAAQRKLEADGPEEDAFGEYGRRTGAATEFQRLAGLLSDRTRRAGEVLVEAAGELREVTGVHLGGDDESAHEFNREQEW